MNCSRPHTTTEGENEEKTLFYAKKWKFLFVNNKYCLLTQKLNMKTGNYQILNWVLLWQSTRLGTKGGISFKYTMINNSYYSNLCFSVFSYTNNAASGQLTRYVKAGSNTNIHLQAKYLTLNKRLRKGLHLFNREYHSPSKGSLFLFYEKRILLGRKDKNILIKDKRYS